MRTYKRNNIYKMGKPGGRVKVMKSGAMKEDISQVTGMFNQMLGTERPEASVVRPKYEELMRTLESISRLTTTFGTSVLVKMFPEYIDEFKKIVLFSTNIKQECLKMAIPQTPVNPLMSKEVSLVDKPLSTEEAAKIAQEDIKKYQTDYAEYSTKIVDNYLYLKECNIIKRLIKVCSILQKQKKYIGDENKLSAEFIMASVEPDLCLLDAFTMLPFKQMFINDKLKNNADAKKYVLVFLHMMFGRTYDIYKIITSPDVDVDKFVEIVAKSIDEIKTKIPRCNEAFDKIKNATHLLKDNFGDYYKDFVESENPTIIMENFISDVAQSAEGSPQLIMQFKRIISFYRKNAEQHMQSNPQLKQVFSMVNSQLSTLENMGRDKKKKSKDDNDDDESNEDLEESEESEDIAEKEELAQKEKAALEAQKSLLKELSEEKKSKKTSKKK